MSLEAIMATQRARFALGSADVDHQKWQIPRMAVDELAQACRAGMLKQSDSIWKTSPRGRLRVYVRCKCPSRLKKCDLVREPSGLLVKYSGTVVYTKVMPRFRKQDGLHLLRPGKRKVGR